MTTQLSGVVTPEFLAAREALEIALPDPTRMLDQDEEWFLVHQDGEWKRLRLHDYDEVFAIQGLYERLVYDILQTRSPTVIRDIFAEALRRNGANPETLTVLDLGAGSGCVAEELKDLGIATFVGADISGPGAMAANRDRPGLYADYAVGDLCDLPTPESLKLEQYTFNAMTCVAALGFGDIPPAVFAEAFNRVEDSGWIVFTIKADFLEDRADQSGFSRMIRDLLDKGVLEVVEQQRYQHRVNTAGEGLDYVAFVGRKNAAITPDLIPSE